MRHTITLSASPSIKSQRIHCKPLPNFQQDQIVKIQQDGNTLYAIYTSDQPPSSHTSSLSLTYMKMNHLQQQTLATMCKINSTGKSKFVEIELSEMDYNLVNSNFGVLDKVFLDQVNVIWPQARIPLYYNDSNYVILMPKCKQLQLVDAYAAISFMVKVEGVNNKRNVLNKQQQSNQQQQQLQFEDRIMIMGRVDCSLRSQKQTMFGYDNVLYVSREEFMKLKRFRLGKNGQSNQIIINQFYCTIQPVLPFLTCPTYQEFQQYKRLQTQKKLPQLKPILVQFNIQQQEQSIKKHILGIDHQQQDQQKKLVDQTDSNQDNKELYFSCTQVCKLSLGIPEQLILTQQSLLYNNSNNNQSFQTTTLDMFLKQIAEKIKYQIYLQLPKIYRLGQNQIQNIKMRFAESFTTVIKQKKEFAFLQNYCPFIVEGYVCGVVVEKMVVNKKGYQPLKSFLMVKDISVNKQQQNSQNYYQMVKNIIQKSLNITQDLPAQKVSQWLPVVKHIQSCNSQIQGQQIQKDKNNDDLKFRAIFETCYKQQLHECCQFLTTQTQTLSPSPNPSKLLITTYSSNGKTYLHNYLTSTTTSTKQLNHRSWYIDCHPLINPNNRIDYIKDYLQAAITFCPYKILFFDNIDSMIPLIEEGDQMRQKEKISARVLGQWLFELLQCNNKAAIFTAKSQANIDSNFKFNKVIKLKNPNRQLRAHIVNSFKFNKPTSWFDEFIDKTESFSLGSLAHYMISQEIPVKNLTKRKNDFSKIVGLDQAKRVIRSVIEKPNRFGFIYEKVKIKVPRGILLYGATGNGKTALGSSVQDQFPMKYFTVKGSDILSKYIGGSEAAVRDIFEKALSVAPSIIFFDEFESIVPRRNSSGTGVTDRVVNQFLCYLDGVSSTTGVFIIAASSRPDLIDPALLRPGRIDSHLYLQYPTQHQRSQLLSLFNNSIKLQINDQQFIQSTNNYSYSDLIGLLKQLRIKRSSEVLKSKQHPQVEEFKYISKELFYQTLKSYRIGTNVEEQKLQNELYIRFKQGKGPEIKKQKFIQM